VIFGVDVGKIGDSLAIHVEGPSAPQGRSPRSTSPWTGDLKPADLAPLEGFAKGVADKLAPAPPTPAVAEAKPAPTDTPKAAVLEPAADDSTSCGRRTRTCAEVVWLPPRGPLDRRRWSRRRARSLRRVLRHGLEREGQVRLVGERRDQPACQAPSCRPVSNRGQPRLHDWNLHGAVGVALAAVSTILFVTE